MNFEKYLFGFEKIEVWFDKQKEGAFAGIVIGIFVWLMRDSIPWFIDMLNKIFIINDSITLLIIIVTLCMVIGMGIDALYSPRK